MAKDINQQKNPQFAAAPTTTTTAAAGVNSSLFSFAQVIAKPLLEPLVCMYGLGGEKREVCSISHDELNVESGSKEMEGDGAVDEGMMSFRDSESNDPKASRA